MGTCQIGCPGVNVKGKTDIEVSLIFYFVKLNSSTFDFLFPEFYLGAPGQEESLKGGLGFCCIYHLYE